MTTYQDKIEEVIKEVLANKSLDSRAKQVCIVYLRKATKQARELTLKEVEEVFVWADWDSENLNMIRKEDWEKLKALNLKTGGEE